MISVVDNFFSNPDKIVNLAKSLKFKQSDGYYPGQRTEKLHIAAPDIFNQIVLKVLALYFDYNTSEVSYSDTNMYFQKVLPFDKNKKSILNEGLIHQDTHYTLAGVIYLDKNQDLNAGTSIYRRAKELKDEEKKHAKKKELYKINQNKMSESSIKQYKKILKECNKGYEETIKVSNVYNRLILYPADSFHAGNYGVTQDRLTLVFFIKTINANSDLPAIRHRFIEPFPI